MRRPCDGYGGYGLFIVKRGELVVALLVQGDSRNLKLTLPQDEYIVRLLLADKSHAPA